MDRPYAGGHAGPPLRSTGGWLLGGAPGCAAVELGVVPSARGSLSMEPSGLYLTVWDAKRIYRILVLGAQPWPPVVMVPRVALPLIGQQ